MRVRYYYRCDYSGGLLKALTDSRVFFKYDQQLNWITFYLFDDDPCKVNLEHLLPPPVFGEYQFTEAELNSSKWLLVRSVNQKFDDKNTEKTFSFSCQYERTFDKFTTKMAHHRKQVAPYEFASPIKWGQSHFYSSIMSGYETLFCDDIAKSVLEGCQFKGLRFDPVLLYKKGIAADNIHQLVFTEQLPAEAIVINEGFKEKRCPFCGKKQYSYTRLSRIGVRESYLGEVDSYCTPEMFGDGFAHSFLIISNSVYQCLSKKQLSKNLLFEPLLTS